MSFLKEFYEQSLAETEKNIRFWEEYLNSLKSLDFNVFTDQLKVPALIPIGSRVFFRGEIKHTNEVTVALGADYFVKCSVKEAEVLKQHRIKDAESKLQTYKKEKTYLENRMSLNKCTVFDNEGQEIVEVYSEEEDKAWRVKHRENVRKYKQRKIKTEDTSSVEVPDEELWNRLEELELEEELANELNSNEVGIEEENEEKSFIVKEENLPFSSKEKDNVSTSLCSTDANIRDDQVQNDNKTNAILKKSTDTPTDILQQVLEKQYELENKLSELKSREKPKSKTERDLILKLDEMDELDELEDEIDRLDDMLQNRGQDDNDEKSFSDQNEKDTKPKSVKLKKSISFADEDDGETLELEFKHSEIEPNLDPYDPEKGITKPSDIYTAHSSLFDQKTSSILKKSKYGDDTVLKERPKVKAVGFATLPDSEDDFEEEVPRTIVVKDIVEKSATEEKKVEMGARPTSLFKKKRMQLNKA